MFLLIHTLKWFQRENDIQSTLTPILSPCPNLSVSLSVRVSGRSSVLQVFSWGSWRTVCAEGWDSHLGSVACRQLGYNRYKELQCTITQLYSSGISAPKKKLAPQRFKSRKKEWNACTATLNSSSSDHVAWNIACIKSFFYFWNFGSLLEVCWLFQTFVIERPHWAFCLLVWMCAIFVFFHLVHLM